VSQLERLLAGGVDLVELAVADSRA
jgi:hypothetical protein